jgi:hypothetical protein
MSSSQSNVVRDEEGIKTVERSEKSRKEVS